jgi:hypothetical protein
MRKRSGMMNERGIALGIAVVALVVIGGLVAAALLVGVPEQRGGRNTIKLEQAFSSAQQGVHFQVAGWKPGHAYNKMAVNDSASFSGTLAKKSGWYRGKVRRLSSSLFLVESEGFSADSLTRQQVGLLVRLRLFELGIRAAVTIQGTIQVSGNPTVDGNDRIPTGWSGCGPLKPPEAGVRLRSLSDVTVQGAAKVLGSPPVEVDSTITGQSLLTFGNGLKFDDLAAMATLVLTPATYNGMAPAFSMGTCNTAVQSNWGDPKNPASACGSYFPIILFKGSSPTKLTTGVGQGILLVEGDLSMAGNVEFYGPIIVKGGISVTGNGNKINGGIVAANGGTIDNNLVGGVANVNYSSCALAKALQINAPGFPVRERSWVEMP